MEVNGLRRVDLNLLTAFAALMAERHVGRAARALGITQSAASKRLARLRSLFGDELFLRAGDGVTPTPRAIEIDAPLRAALRDMAQVIEQGGRFDPTSAERVLRIAANDLFAAVHLPRITARIMATAPGLRLAVRQLPRAAMPDALERGDVDFAVAVLPDAPAILRRAPLPPDEFVCLLAADHPEVGEDGLTLEAFCALPHLLVTLAGDFHGAVDAMLEERGLSRLVALSQPFHFAAPALVAGTRMVCTLPRSVANLAPWPGVRRYPLPLPHSGFHDTLHWHRRSDRDLVHAWVRRQIAETTA